MKAKWLKFVAVLVLIRDGFLRIFRRPTDLHRVIASGWVAVCASHIIYMTEKPINYTVSSDQMVLIVLFGGPLVFLALWKVFSSRLNVILYARQSLMMILVALVHRLFYGLDSPGTMFLNIVTVLLVSFFIPFILANLSPNQVIQIVKDWQGEVKQDYEEDEELESNVTRLAR